MSSLCCKESVAELKNTLLGKTVEYPEKLNPELLFPVARRDKRLELGIDSEQLPFVGFDVWNHYEVSWLNAKGKPIVALAKIVYDCNSPYIVESKSLKLYFNSLNNARFASSAEVQTLVTEHLNKIIQTPVTVTLFPLPRNSTANQTPQFSGINLDDLDVVCSVYTVEPQFLTVTDEFIEETVYSDLLKSNCLVTNQPDWGSVQIHYRGKTINHEGLLRYLVSFRNHNEFHEQCIERIFTDILKQCKPEYLTVHGCYTRRGGIDINPWRSTHTIDLNAADTRLIRQ